MWIAAVTLAMSATAASATAQSPSIETARLQGSFELAGRITAAFNVRGEHVGQMVTRIWTFTSSCPAGPCRTVGLLRARGRGHDSLLLHQLAPGYYVGKGRFYAPLRCGTHINRHGELVPFTIALHITSAIVQNGVVIAARINASYLNRRRINLTRCVVLKSHDAATYHGHLIQSAAARRSAAT